MLEYDNTEFVRRPKINPGCMKSIAWGISKANLCLGLMVKKSLNSKKSLLQNIPLKLDIDELCGPRKKRGEKAAEKMRSASMSTIGSSVNDLGLSAKKKRSKKGLFTNTETLDVPKIPTNKKGMYDIVNELCKDNFDDNTSLALTNELKNLFSKKKNKTVESMDEMEEIVNTFNSNIFDKYYFESSKTLSSVQENAESLEKKHIFEVSVPSEPLLIPQMAVSTIHMGQSRDTCATLLQKCLHGLGGHVEQTLLHTV